MLDSLLQRQSINIFEIAILEALSLRENVRLTEDKGPHCCNVLQVSYVQGFCLVVFYWDFRLVNFVISTNVISQGLGWPYNCMDIPVPGWQPWGIWVNVSQKSAKNNIPTTDKQQSNLKSNTLLSRGFVWIWKSSRYAIPYKSIDADDWKINYNNIPINTLWISLAHFTNMDYLLSQHR